MMLWDWTEAERVLTAWAQWAVDAPDHVTTSLRIMQLPPLEELPELLRGRSVVIIDGAVQGDPAVLDPLRALGPEIDLFGMVPAPALVRLHQDPEEPMPAVGETALIEALPPEAIRALLAVAGPGSGSPLEVVELRQGGGALRRATPGHGAVAGVTAAFVLFTAGLALGPEMAAAKQAHMAALKAALAPYTRRRALPELRRGAGRRRRARSTPARGRGCARSGTAWTPAACSTPTTRSRLGPHMGRIYERIDDHLRKWIDRQSMFFVGTAPLADRRPRQRLAEGADRLAAGARRPHGRLPGHRRQRRGDDRPPPRERAHRRDALRLRGPAADPAPARPRRGRPARRRRASTSCSRRRLPGASRRPRRGARSSSCTWSASPTRAATACRCWPTRASGRTATCRPPSGCASKGRTRMRKYEAKHNRESIDGLPALS